MRTACVQIDDLEKREIALVGSKELCKYFFLQFSAMLKIRYVFSMEADQDEDFNSSFFKSNCNVEFMAFRDVFVREHDILLILCVEHAFREPYDTLLFHKGFEWGSDYVDYMYVIQYYRCLHNVYLKKKNIWIFGAGNNGRFFYERYREAYNICGFVSNYDRENEYLGLPVIRPESLIKQDNFYVVICSDAAVAMAERLCELGLQGGHEYGFEINLPKDLFIAMGTCQIIKIGEYLCRNKNFTDQYHVIMYFDNIYDPCSDADNKRLKCYGEFCDVVLYNVTSVGSMKFRNFAPLVERFYKRAEKLFMPFYYFMGQLPQATDDINIYALRPQGRGYFWFRGDREVNRMLEMGESPEIIIEKVSGERYWTKEEILENFRRELKKVAVLDRFSSFPIRPFIENNYQKMLVFIDGTHFGCQLCFYLADQIALRLGLGIIKRDDKTNIGENRDTSVMPVYPCVRYVLDLQFEELSQFYYVEKDELKYLDFKEYVKTYIRYALNARDIYKESGTIMSW